ncbi:MAG: hypothetical protein IPO27_13600 [Bacteroidetes bacterium]|nr:hypothetical protein [Bacteroidota bacterium]
MQAHCQSRTSQRTDQSFVKELAKPTQDKIVFKKFPTLLKKIKNATHSRHSMTQKLNTDNGLQGRWTRTTGYNTGLAKVAVQYSADTFVVNQSLVLRINICGENRHLRQARKRQVVKKPILENYTSQNSALTMTIYDLG